MMQDLISRQAAIDALNDGAELLRRALDCTDIVGSERDKFAWGLGLIESCIYDMKELPSVNQWTPCSERLPEKSGRYLVTNTRLGAFEVTWNIFYNGKGEAPDGWLYEDGTIAWMPLPEPWKEKPNEIH